MKRRTLLGSARDASTSFGGLDYDDELTRRLWQAVTAYEETLRTKHGRAQQAGYTRRKIAAKGVVATLTDWALHKGSTPGFDALVDNGMADFTGEYIVIQFAYRFEPPVVDAARRRLIDRLVQLPS